MPMKPVTIVIADDHPIVLDVIKAAISKKEGLRIIGAARDGYDLLKLIKRLNPDIAIIDLEMPKLKGYETIAVLRSSHPDLRTIALSGFLSSANRQRAIDAGAYATVSKSLPMTDIIKAVEAVAQGQAYHSAETSFIDEKPIGEEQDCVLTLRETQILKLIAQGKTSKDISDLCNISRWTVDKHRANIRAKLGLKNVAEMVRYAIAKGYFEDKER